MSTDPRADRQDRRPVAPLGFPRRAAEVDPRVDPNVLTAISRIAPGTQLRQGIDDIIRAREGALIVIGEPSELSFMFSGGIRLDQAFTPQLLYELAKMDGAIIVNSAIARIAQANVQLMADYIERACTELGSEGRLIRMQLEEHVSEVPAEKAAIVYDYHADGGADRVAEGLEALAQLPYQDLLEFELLAVLGYPATTNPLDYAVAPRGYRVLTHIPRLPENVIHRLVGELSGLEGIIRASQRDLEAVDAVGTVRAREIREGLRRLQEHNLVDRYLQL